MGGSLVVKSGSLAVSGGSLAASGGSLVVSGGSLAVKGCSLVVKGCSLVVKGGSLFARVFSVFGYSSQDVRLQFVNFLCQHVKVFRLLFFQNGNFLTELINVVRLLTNRIVVSGFLFLLHYFIDYDFKIFKQSEYIADPTK